MSTVRHKPVKSLVLGHPGLVAPSDGVDRTFFGRKAVGLAGILMSNPHLWLYCGCLIMLWEIGAAAASGLIITALFLMVAIAQYARQWVGNVTERLGRRSALRVYGRAAISLLVFCLVVGRACYIASVLVDTQLRSPAVPLVAVSTTSF
jgi:hypothetical protein